MKRLLLTLLCLGLPTLAWAADQPRIKRIPHVGGWSLDEIVDVTSLGSVTGTTVTAKTFRWR